MMKHQEHLSELLRNRRCTLLNIGPMSQNCVDAVIELARELRLPLGLIASRRQIEAAAHGGGYVNNWTTETFAEYVRAKDPERTVFLARDHGGPWQNYAEVKGKMNLAQAMESAKSSFETDIRAGFDMLHLDPSIDIHKTPTQTEILERLFELYEFCHAKARENNADLMYEFGTDEQSGDQQDLAEFEDLIQKLLAFCEKNNYPKPFFVVVQTGTKVKELRNVGNIGANDAPKGLIPPKVYVRKLVEICNRYGLHLKEHNADYLSDDILAWHPRVGIHAINVAPEFGVCETRHILDLCDQFDLRKEKERFLEMAYNSKKWDKWLIPDSTATDDEKAAMAGHYVFALPEFLELKQAIAAQCMKRRVDLDFSIRQGLKFSIMRYIYHLNLHHGYH